MADVLLENISKRFRGPSPPAVDGLTLHVRDGELLALVGPSGCGKTTTLRMIAGLEQPTEGVIRIGGRVVNDVHPRDRDIAMVFQDYALYPHMTVRRNMAFGLVMRRTPRAEIDRRVQTAAEVLELVDVLDRKPRQLSGGQRQRAALGKAMVRQPKCMLLDEPLGSLDLGLRSQMRAEIKSLHSRLGMTMIHVTHDQEEAMILGDRMAVMCRGEIQQAGEPLEVYRHPVNRFVAGFVGSPAMNFMDGRLAHENGAPVFVGAGDIKIGLPAEIAPGTPIDGPVVLGVRPEHLGCSAQDGMASLPAKVDLIEPLGDLLNIRTRTTAGVVIVARVSAKSARSIRTGQQMMWLVDPSDLLLFEPGEFGRRLTSGPSEH